MSPRACAEDSQPQQYVHDKIPLMADDQPTSPRPGASGGPLVPAGPIVSLQFMVYSWRILKSRAALLIPAALGLSAIAAAINLALTIRAAGGMKQAAATKFDLATSLMNLVQDPAQGGQSSAATIVAALLLTSLVIPSIANSGLIPVIDDAIDDNRKRGSEYFRVAGRKISGVIASQVVGSLAAVGPIALFYVAMISAGGMNTTLAGALEVLVGLPLAFGAVYLTIGWLFSAQFVVLRGRSPIRALRDSAALARGNRLRITSIFLMTALLSTSIAMLIATPVAWLGTLNGTTAAGQTLGSQIATAFITTWAQQTVTIIATASVLTLLFADLRRRRDAQ